MLGGYNYGNALGGFGKFQLDISFPLEIIAMFFFTLVVLLGTIHKRLRVALSTDVFLLYGVGSQLECPQSTFLQRAAVQCLMWEACKHIRKTLVLLHGRRNEQNKTCCGAQKKVHMWVGATCPF